jgi:formylglycine-generating enzyme required for sulfatase activity
LVAQEETTMLICPNGHGTKEGRFCPDCGGELVAALPPGDSLRIRSPEAHANASVNPTFILPGAAVGGSPPALAKCPRCGHRNSEADVFDCQGPCGRANLCRRHFDEEYDLCRDCAAVLRGTVAKEAARQARLEAEVKAKAEALVRAEAAQAQVEVEVRSQAAQLAQAQAELAQVRAQRAALEKALAEWRPRAEKAEATLAAIAAKAGAEAKAEAAKQQPIWQRIGIELLRVPAGDFLYGEDKQKVTLPEYCIAKTPVTNAQYKAFVDAIGCQPPQHWPGGQVPKGRENHPVDQVDWQDAQNFCAWAGLRLPTEQEWEKAARGTDGREYPWGGWQAGRCNSSEAKIRGTSPVDRFPSGASPYGLLDMAGNVSEWCGDLYLCDPTVRPLRGGSFFFDARFVRCAAYDWRDPGDLYGFIGFRVASSGL